jgi:hypothetical protein
MQRAHRIQAWIRGILVRRKSIPYMKTERRKLRLQYRRQKREQARKYRLMYQIAHAMDDVDITEAVIALAHTVHAAVRGLRT